MAPYLSTDLLLAAYSQGYFPMPHPISGEICWFNPDPRAVLPLDAFHVSRSLARTLKKVPFEIRCDTAFEAVIDACAARPETWINSEIREAFVRLFREGHAHSFEVWLDDELVGGTYGLGIGAAFFAESKFHRVTDASKVALYCLTVHLRERGYRLLEVQFLTEHLSTLGVREISASVYETELRQALRVKTSFLPCSLTSAAASLRAGQSAKNAAESPPK